MRRECEKLIKLLHEAKMYAANIMLHSDIDDVIDTSYDELQAEYLIKNGVEVKGNEGQLIDELKMENGKLKIAKSEAIKEFAERLKEIFQRECVNIKDIDNLVKEMTEGKDNA